MSGDLHEDLKTIEPADWLVDEGREFLPDVSSRLLGWIVDRCEPELESRRDRPRTQDDLKLRWLFTEWVGVLCSHLPAATARQSFVDMVLAVPGEPGLDPGLTHDPIPWQFRPLRRSFRSGVLPCLRSATAPSRVRLCAEAKVEALMR